MGNVLFRVESGAGVGPGHLQRCVSLATALAELGHESTFIVSGGAHSLARVERAGFRVVDLATASPGSEADAQTVLAAIADHRCGAIVTDSYLVDQEYMRVVASSSAALVAIDDLARETPPASIIVNTTIDADDAVYDGVGRDAELLMGIGYAILGPQYWDLGPREITGKPQRVLMTLGGADGKNLTPVLLASLDGVNADFTVDVVIGPFNVHQVEVEEASHACERAVQLLTGQESLQKHMWGTDIAISAAGQTLYELAVTGTPTVAIQVADNQAPNMRGFAEEGCIESVVAGNRKDAGEATANKVAALINDQQRRLAMSAAGRRLIDGQGARRVARAIDRVL